MIRELMSAAYPVRFDRMALMLRGERHGAAHDDPRDRQQIVDRDPLVDRVRELDPARAEQDAGDRVVAVQAHVAAVADAGERRRAAQLGRGGVAHEPHPGIADVGFAGPELAAGPGDPDRRAGVVGGGRDGALESGPSVRERLADRHAEAALEAQLVGHLA